MIVNAELAETLINLGKVEPFTREGPHGSAPVGHPNAGQVAVSYFGPVYGDPDLKGRAAVVTPIEFAWLIGALDAYIDVDARVEGLEARFLGGLVGEEVRGN